MIVRSPCPLSSRGCGPPVGAGGELSNSNTPIGPFQITVFAVGPRPPGRPLEVNPGRCRGPSSRRDRVHRGGERVGRSGRKASRARTIAGSSSCDPLGLGLASAPWPSRSLVVLQPGFCPPPGPPLVEVKNQCRRDQHLSHLSINAFEARRSCWLTLEPPNDRRQRRFGSSMASPAEYCSFPFHQQPGHAGFQVLRVTPGGGGMAPVGRRQRHHSRDIAKGGQLAAKPGSFFSSSAKEAHVLS